MSDAAEVVLDTFAPYHGSPVTPWRQEIADMRERLARFILDKADPEEALRIAHDTAADLSSQVKKTLKEVHGRTFDRLFDRALINAEPRASGRLDDRILDALADGQPRTILQLAALMDMGAPSGSNAIINSVCLDLIQSGRLLRRKGAGTLGSAYLYSVPKK